MYLTSQFATCVFCYSWWIFTGQCGNVKPSFIEFCSLTRNLCSSNPVLLWSMHFLGRWWINFCLAKFRNYQEVFTAEGVDKVLGCAAVNLDSVREGVTEVRPWPWMSFNCGSLFSGEQNITSIRYPLCSVKTGNIYFKTTILLCKWCGMVFLLFFADYG